MAACHLEAHTRDWLSESARSRSVVRSSCYVRRAGNFSAAAAAALETDSGQQRIEAPNRSLFLRDATTIDSREMCPGGSTKVDRCVGSGQLPMLEFTSSLFFIFGVTFHRRNTVFTFFIYFVVRLHTFLYFLAKKLKEYKKPISRTCQSIL